MFIMGELVYFFTGLTVVVVVVVDDNVVVVGSVDCKASFT